MTKHFPTTVTPSLPALCGTSDIDVIFRCAPSNERHSPSTVLATSASTLVGRNAGVLHPSSADDPNHIRLLCEDRRGFFEHLYPRPLFVSTVRVSVLQGTMILANLLTDQLEYETSNEGLVSRGELSPEDAEHLNEEWEKREWAQRRKAYPRKVLVGLAKFHAVTFCMRLYESIASHLVSDVTLDKLTIDTFKYSVRKSKQINKSDGSKENNRKEMRRDAFETCLYANAIAFLADYTVQQIILTGSYWVYSRRHRHQRKLKPQSRDEDDDRSDGKMKASDATAMVLSFFFKSTRLIVSRAIGLVASAAGGAWGTCYWPGWGMLVGIQAGDGIIGSLLE